MSDAIDVWETWFDEYGSALVLFARQWTRSHADAEDAVQEAFIRFWQGGHRRARDPKAYLFASVKRAALGAGRATRRRQRREESVGRGRPEQVPLLVGEENAEAREALQVAISRLPPEQREVLVLKIWGELTFAQVAEVAGTSPNTAASRYYYALESLRRELAGNVTR
jgi:RNA polymerase sigma-70 factor (ECF subfamily)